MRECAGKSPASFRAPAAPPIVASPTAIEPVRVDAIMAAAVASFAGGRPVKKVEPLPPAFALDAAEAVAAALFEAADGAVRALAATAVAHGRESRVRLR